MSGPFYGCDNGDCATECVYDPEDLKVYEGKLWCEGCWDDAPTIWTDGDGGDSGGDWLRWWDLEKFVPPEKARIAQLEALIADAPHQSENCKVRWNAHSGEWEYNICSCWKSSALDTKEKSNVHD